MHIFKYSQRKGTKAAVMQNQIPGDIKELRSRRLIELSNKNQKEIKNLMIDEIIKRYQYQEGLYQYYIKSNPEIKKAVSVLSTSAEYNSILKL